MLKIQKCRVEFWTYSQREATFDQITLAMIQI